MFSTGRCRYGLVAALLLVSAASIAAQNASEPALYRLFLRDGSTLVSYGEYARVADRVVMSLPIGSSLQLFSLPADRVDWEKTDAYAESVRASRYAATRGPDDLALLGQAVTRALGDIALTEDPNRKIAMATEARQNVTRWAAEHFGYAADRVAQFASMFDAVIAETRTRAGEKNVEMTMVATMAAAPSTPLLPPPTLKESIDQAIAAAALSPEATERTSLLWSIQTVLEKSAGEAWTTPYRARVAAALAIEERATRGYDLLTRTALQNAERYASTADVTGVERVIRRTLAEDDRLGQRRPQEMASLLAVLDRKLDAARRLRLARDSWAARAEAVRQFRAALVEPLAMLRNVRAPLDEIRRLAGPPPLQLTRLIQRTNAANTLLALVAVPAEGQTVHSLLRNAAQFATRAAQGRQRAVMSGQMDAAWEAASAASGALIFLERAMEELEQLAKPPVMQGTR